jgi:hypothetical protein
MKAILPVPGTASLPDLDGTASDPVYAVVDALNALRRAGTAPERRTILDSLERAMNELKRQFR